jgi:hypothetical protein
MHFVLLLKAEIPIELQTIALSEASHTAFRIHYGVVGRTWLFTLSLNRNLSIAQSEAVHWLMVRRKPEGRKTRR